MRGKKAKAIRRTIYKDMSQRVREYKPGHEPKSWNLNFSMLGPAKNPMCICAGLRASYQAAKRALRHI